MAADALCLAALTCCLPPLRSHRPALMAFHDIVLSLDGEGGWSLHPGHRSLEGKQVAASAAGGASVQPSVPPPPRPGGKARGGDADDVLRGMTQQLEREEELQDGNEGFSGAQCRQMPCVSRELAWCVCGNLPAGAGVAGEPAATVTACIAPACSTTYGDGCLLLCALQSWWLPAHRLPAQPVLPPAGRHG